MLGDWIDMRAKYAKYAIALAMAALGAEATAGEGSVRVTPDNFPRAESDLFFSGIVKDGGSRKFMHRREPTPIARQTAIRMTRDTLYSAAVFDLDAGPVTITLPDPGKRFLSMQVIDEDAYTVEVVYGLGVHRLIKEGIGTRYIIVAVRILVNPNDPNDVDIVRALQDAIKVSQPGGPGAFKIPIGTPRPRSRCATPCSSWRRRFPTRRACSARAGRSIPSGA
jgi:Protein of unknown function (DUF1254)